VTASIWTTFFVSFKKKPQTDRTKHRYDLLPTYS